MIKLTSTIQGYCAQSAPIVVLVFVWSQRGICVQKGAGMWLIQVSYTYMQECMYKFKDKWNLKTDWHILYIHMQIYIFWGTVPVRLQWTLSCYHPTICIYVCVFYLHLYLKHGALHNWVFIIPVFGIKLLSFNYFSVEVVENAWMDVGSIDNCVQLWRWWWQLWHSFDDERGWIGWKEVKSPTTSLFVKSG